VNILWGSLVILGVATLTTTAMLLVRRRAPEGSYYSDGDRASGVFGVLATGFSVLLGFIIFLAFTSYDEARTGAETEATVVNQQVETAQYLPDPISTDLTGQLICYGRSVVGPEWRSQVSGTQGDSVNPWGVAMFRTVANYDPHTNRQQSAYDRWMDQTSDRQQARISRIHGAEGIIPFPLWLVLIVICGVIFVYMLFFADSAERAVTQGMMMASITVVIGLLMLLLVFFDHPQGDGVGRLQPTAMERTLRTIDDEIRLTNLQVTPPCDARGIPR